MRNEAVDCSCTHVLIQALSISTSLDWEEIVHYKNKAQAICLLSTFFAASSHLQGFSPATCSLKSEEIKKKNVVFAWTGLSYVFVNLFLITVSSASCTYPKLPWQRPFWGGMSDTGPCRAEWSQDKSRGQTGRLLKKKEPKGFYQEGKEKAPRVQINKITPRFFYAHPDLHPSRPEMPHTRPKMSGVLLTCSLATIDGGEKRWWRCDD